MLAKKVKLILSAYVYLNYNFTINDTVVFAKGIITG